MFVLAGALLNTDAYLGAAVTIVGHAIIVAALIMGIVRLVKKERNKRPVLTVMMTILGIGLFVAFTSLATFVI